jgi:hypothetical protein
MAECSRPWLARGPGGCGKIARTSTRPIVTLIVAGDSTAAAVSLWTLRAGMTGNVSGCLTMIAGIDGRSG